MLDIQDIIKWLQSGNEYEAADILTECNISLEWIDMVFGAGESEMDVYEVRIHAPRHILSNITAGPNAVSEQIEAAVQECALGSNIIAGNVVWVPLVGGPSRDPLEASLSERLSKVDSAHVRIAWQKALKRKGSDPEGAITAARTLLETVCKHILNHEGVAYSGNSDLPRLYHLTAEHLSLAPSQHTEKLFKSILGKCESIVSDLASMRNKLGDAHGKDQGTIQPDTVHAELAVNLAGSLSTFIISVWEESVVSEGKKRA